MAEARIRTIVLVVALLLLTAVPAFVQTRGDSGTPAQATATTVTANESDTAPANGAPKIADASRDTADEALPTPKNEAANETQDAQSDATHETASGDATQVAQSDETPKADSTEATPSVAGSWFTPGNIVVAVAGCGVFGGTPPNSTPSSTACATQPLGGTGIGYTGYGDDQASVWTLFQYTPSGASSVAYVNSLQLPQTASGANSAITNDFGSQSEGTVQLSGNGEYLTMMGYGINAADFNVNYVLYCPGNTGTLASSCVPENGNPATAQTGTLTSPVGGVTGTTAVPRVVALIDPNGNVNTSTVLYNIFDENDARSAYSPDGINVYVSGQGCKTCGPTPNQIPLTTTNPPFDNTMGVYYSPIGAANTAPTPITGNDNGPTGCTTTTTCTASEDTRMVQIYNNTLYVSTDAKPGSSTGGYNRSLIGTLGDPPATSQFTCTGIGEGCGTGYGPYGPALMTGLDNAGGTGKVVISAGNNGNGLNVISLTCSVTGTTTLTCPSGPFSSADAGDTVSGTDIPSGTTISTYTNATSVVMSNAATGSVSSDSISLGLQINMSPQNFFFASPTVLYVADTGSPKNSSNNDTICSTDGGGSKSVGNGGLQKWINISTTFTGAVTGSKTVTATAATFSYLDVGLPISGTGIPAGTTIASVTSPTVAKLSTSSTTGSNETITIGPGWSLAYTLYQGLNLVLNVDCDAANDNTTGTGATGLYGLTGVVNSGVATLYVTNYPNDDLLQTYLYGITDTLATTAFPATSFTELDSAPTGSVFRGVSFVPSIPNGSVEITSAPAGLTISTAGTGCDPGSITTPRLEPWTASSSCTLSVTSPQTVGGVQYTFSHWQDSSTGLSDVVTAPSTTASYTATFTAQYQLTTTAGTGGTVSSGGYYNAGANATITATPSGGNCFVNFTGAPQIGYAPVSPSTTNPFSLQMNSPESITATFGALGITSPAGGSTFSSSAATFSWSACAIASAYWVDIGKEAGGNEYAQSGSLSSSTYSYSTSSLPTDGSTVYVTWYYLLNGSWTSVGSTYTAFGGSSNKGMITTPSQGSTLSGTSVAFTWSPGSGATAYWIDAGSSTGGNQYFQSGNLGNVTTETVTGLPNNGSTVYVTLYSYVAGQWLSNSYTYTAYSLASSAGVLTTPQPGTVLTSSTVTFQWTPGSEATSYWLDTGSTSGGNQYSQSGSLGNVTSTTVSGLPTNGGQVYATLYSLVSGQWVGSTYTYTASNPDGGLAQIQSPTANTTLSGNSQTFTWNSDSAATGYWMDIGTSAGGNTIYQSGNLGTATSTTVNTLPADGSTIYVTLYSYVNGQWLSNQYTYVSGP